MQFLLARQGVLNLALVNCDVFLTIFANSLLCLHGLASNCVTYPVQALLICSPGEIPESGPDHVTRVTPTFPAFVRRPESNRPMFPGVNLLIRTRWTTALFLLDCSRRWRVPGAREVDPRWWRFRWHIFGPLPLFPNDALKNAHVLVFVHYS